MVRDLTPIVRRSVHDAEILEAAEKMDLNRIRAEALEGMFAVCDPVLLSGEGAQPHLERLRLRLEAEAQLLVNKRSAFEWLWYLRRLRGQFNWNDLGTTDPYCQALAEALCSMSTKPDPEMPTGGSFNMRFPIESEDIRDLLRLRGIVGLLYENHGTTRYAGKGSNIQFTRAGGPIAVPTPALKRAVKLYDSRNADLHNLLANAGLAADLTAEIEESNVLSVFMLAAWQPGLSVAPEWNGTLDTPLGFGFGAVDLAQIDILTNQQLPVHLRWPSPLPALLALSLVPLHSFFADTKGLADIFRRFGYFYISREALLRLLEWSLHLLRMADSHFVPVEVLPATPEEAMVDLLGVKISADPPTGGRILHQLGEALVVDLNAASSALLRCLDRPVFDGAEVNEWSDTFEIHIQEIIDQSGWAPSANVAKLRTRTLRRGGIDLTDVDAIGEQGGVLLLVSCKSRPYNQAYDRGEYSEVRNVRTLAEESVGHWRFFVEDVDRNRVGDNYDFSRFTKIVGVVVLPFAPFVLEGPCTAETIEGLRWVSSSTELRGWSKDGA